MNLILYPIRDLVFFWCRWFAVGAPSAMVYPIKITGGLAMSVALLLAPSSLCRGRVRQTPDDGDRTRNRYFNRCRRDRTHPSPGTVYEGVHPMMFGLPFATFRVTILTLALLARIYLFVRARQAIRSSCRSDRFKLRAEEKVKWVFFNLAANFS